MVGFRPMLFSVELRGEIAYNHRLTGLKLHKMLVKREWDQQTGGGSPGAQATRRACVALKEDELVCRKIKKFI
jgi:hypothetical protein